MRSGWDCQTCGWQSWLSLFLSLSGYEVYLIITTIILKSFIEHIYSGLVGWANCTVGSPHSAKASLRCGDVEGGHDYPQQAGERRRSTEGFSFLIHLRAFPRLASSGQHEPVLWAANQDTAPEDDWDTITISSSSSAARRRLIAEDSWIHSGCG